MGVGSADGAGARTRQAAHLGIEVDAGAKNQQLRVSRAPRNIKDLWYNVPVVTTLHVRLRGRAFAALDTAYTFDKRLCRSNNGGNPQQSTPRDCLRCGETFDSTWIGNRLCQTYGRFATNFAALRPSLFPEPSGARPGKTHA